MRSILCLALVSAAAYGDEFEISENSDEIRIQSSALEAAIRKVGYVSGVYRQSFLDKKSGFRDPGMGLDIADFLLEPGSDSAYRDKLDPMLFYDFNNLSHGQRAKRKTEGPQICTRAKSLSPEVIRGKDFVGVRMGYTFHLSSPDRKPGSRWTQTIVFPAGKRYFVSSDRITSVNDRENVAFRTDLPGHVRHKNGDSFSEIYLSYQGKVPSSEFSRDFPPDEKNHYLRGKNKAPGRMIRAYRLRDPATGKEGPWLAGMTLDPSVVYEAWCHQRGYVCMIQEIWGKPIRAGQSFEAVYVVGYFDSIAEMEQVYDRYKGSNALEVTSAGWKAVKK
jgi:hypothetical protein